MYEINVRLYQWQNGDVEVYAELGVPGVGNWRKSGATVLSAVQALRLFVNRKYPAGYDKAGVSEKTLAERREILSTAVAKLWELENGRGY